MMWGGHSLSVDWPHFLSVHSWLILILWEWNQPYPCLSHLKPLCTWGDDVTRHPTMQPPAATAVSITIISYWPQFKDTTLQWQLFYFGFIAVSGARNCSDTKKNKWNNHSHKAWTSHSLPSSHWKNETHVMVVIAWGEEAHVSNRKDNHILTKQG